MRTRRDMSGSTLGQVKSLLGMYGATMTLRIEQASQAGFKVFIESVPPVAA